MTGKSIMFRYNCSVCGKETFKKMYKIKTPKCEECLKQWHRDYDKKIRSEVVKPKTIWDEKLEFYKLTKNYYGRTNQ